MHSLLNEVESFETLTLPKYVHQPRSYGRAFTTATRKKAANDRRYLRILPLNGATILTILFLRALAEA